MKDINTTPVTPIVDSSPMTGRNNTPFREDRKFLKVGSRLFFTAHTIGTGRELFAYDGTKTWLVKDIRPGTVGSDPNDLMTDGSRVWFSADDGVHGREIWVSDGTKAGTKLFCDAVIGSLGSAPEDPAYLKGGKVVFGAASPTGQGLWVSDGTTAGSKLLIDYGKGTRVRYFTTDTAGTQVYFQYTAPLAMKRGGLWVTDGTKAGSRLLLSVYTPRANSGLPSAFRPLGSKLLFTAYSYNKGLELWITDGTSSGTKLLKDVYSGTVSGTTLSTGTVLGNRVLFVGRTALQGTELWVSDGTTAGTRLIKDMVRGRSSSTIYDIVANAAGTKAWIAIRGSGGVFELWTSDGTSAGTGLYKGSLPGKPDYLQPSGGKVFFSLFESKFGYEPWVSDGTTAGTHRIADIQPGYKSGCRGYITEVSPGRVAFPGNSPRVGLELCITKGSLTTTTFEDISTWTLGKVTANDKVGSITPLFGRFLFFASDGDGPGQHGSELWISDGTASGTKMLKDIMPGTGSGVPSGNNFMVRVGHRVFFAALDKAHGLELWTSDGTLAGTHMVKDLKPGTASSFPQRMKGIGNKLYFMAEDASTGAEPWVSDGTAAGTFMLKDIQPGRLGSYPRDFAGLPGKVMFGAHEPWITDGTQSGTKLLKDIMPGYPSSDPRFFALFRGKIYFMAYHYKTGGELWVSDFTSAGTMLLKDLWPGKTSSMPSSLCVSNARLLFMASHATKGLCFWTSDGTSAGTKILSPIPSTRSNPFPWAAVGSRRIYFRSQTVLGYEPGFFDMSTRTWKDLDLAPGGSSSNPEGFAVFGSKVLMAASKTPFPGADQQLVMIENGATATMEGDILGPASLWADDPILGSTSIFKAWTSVANPIHVLFLGVPARPALPVSSQYLLHYKLAASLYLGVGVGKDWSFALPFPNQSSLLGAQVVLQDWALNATQFPQGWALSNGALLTLGHR